jgi:hypothetical protein
MYRNREQEKEIATILINSSLYPNMSPAERELLLRYLVSSYFDLMPNKNVGPFTWQCGPDQ